MSGFVDFALATGPAKVSVVATTKRNLNIPTTDFYRPLREAIARIGREQREPQHPEPIFTDLMFNVGDERARRIYPGLAEGFYRFRRAAGAPRWVEPKTTAMDAGPVRVAVNPEVGFVLPTAEGQLPHHLKLYLRAEPLSQRRVDITVAMMAVALPVPEKHRLGVLDLKNARMWYLSDKSAALSGWAKLSALVHAEVAAYGVAWGLS
jgi:hypothetical protein